MIDKDAIWTASSEVIKQLAVIVNLPRTDKQFADEVVPREPLMAIVQRIKTQVDVIEKAMPRPVHPTMQYTAPQAEKAPSVQAVAWMRDDGMKAMVDDEKQAWIESGHPDVVAEYTKPLTLAAPQQPSVPEQLESYLNGQEFHELCMDYRGARLGTGHSEFTALQKSIQAAFAAAAPKAVEP